MEPEAGQVEAVPGLQADPVHGAVRVVGELLKVRPLGVNHHPADLKNIFSCEKKYFVPADLFRARDSLGSPGPGLVLAVHGRGEAPVGHPGQVRGGLEDDVLVTSHHAVDILVRVLVH